jgi:NAD(P)-dependent dehydrogenase (short-subunit alcohol dehydrogenase family)
LVFVISSRIGSITEVDDTENIYYRSSKAALNAAIQGIAAALRPRNIGILLLYPGGFMTRMGPEKDISKRKSLDGMRKGIEVFTMDKIGALPQ